MLFSAMQSYRPESSGLTRKMVWLLVLEMMLLPFIQVTDRAGGFACTVQVISAFPSLDTRSGLNGPTRTRALSEKRENQRKNRRKTEQRFGHLQCTCNVTNDSCFSCS